MRRALVVLAILVAAGSLLVTSAALRADETKWVRGTVTAIGADSLTVKAGAKEMKFGVDQKTEVIARGAGTRARAAAEAGKSGPKLSEVVKVGQAVEVHYHDMGGTLHAAEVRAIASAGGESSETSGKSFSGTVTAIAADSVSVKSANREAKFSVDAKTRVIGQGAGTVSREKGGAPAITDLIGTGDLVRIIYHEMGATLHAGEIFISSKAKKATD